MVLIYIRLRKSPKTFLFPHEALANSNATVLKLTTHFRCAYRLQASLKSPQTSTARRCCQNLRLLEPKTKDDLSCVSPPLHLVLAARLPCDIGTKQTPAIQPPDHAMHCLPVSGPPDRSNVFYPNRPTVSPEAKQLHWLSHRKHRWLGSTLAELPSRRPKIGQLRRFEPHTYISGIPLSPEQTARQ